MKHGVLLLVFFAFVLSASKAQGKREGLYGSFEVGLAQGVGLFDFEDGTQFKNGSTGARIRLAAGAFLSPRFSMGLAVSVDGNIGRNMAEFIPGNYTTIPLVLEGRYFFTQKRGAAFISGNLGTTTVLNASSDTEGGRKFELGLGKVLPYHRFNFIASVSYNLQRHKEARYRIELASPDPNVGIQVERRSQVDLHYLAFHLGLLFW